MKKYISVWQDAHGKTVYCSHEKEWEAEDLAKSQTRAGKPTFVAVITTEFEVGVSKKEVK